MSTLTLDPSSGWHFLRIESAPAVEEREPLPGSEPEEAYLLNALKEGDESAFADLVGQYHGSLKRFARSFGATDAVAEEIVQETWLGVLQGLDSFAGRSSFKGWLFGILKNQARRRSERERRSAPFSALRVEEPDEPVVDSLRFQGPGAAWPDHWSAPPRPWQDPQRRLASLEAREHIREAIALLPERQRLVVALRDIEGLDSDEVSELLELSDANQRVLLHRGRAAVRNALEGYMDG